MGDEWVWKLEIKPGRKYDPNQPRVPAGQTGGGRWASGSGGAGKPPSIPIDDLAFHNDAGAMAILTSALPPPGSVQVDHFLAASDEQAAAVKYEICTELSQKTGLPYDTTNTLIKAWAGSSADLNELSLQLQKAAADEFGLELRTSVSERLTKVRGIEAKVYDSLESLGLTDTQARGFLRAMYDSTQKRFAQDGIKEVTLFRGSKSFRGHEKNAVRLSGNPMQSFSVDSFSASDFGAVAAMTVPVSSIISTARTGFGCLLEGEMVVLVGANSKHSVIVLP